MDLPGLYGILQYRTPTSLYLKSGILACVTLPYKHARHSNHIRGGLMKPLHGGIRNALEIRKCRPLGREYGSESRLHRTDCPLWWAVSRNWSLSVFIIAEAAWWSWAIRVLSTTRLLSSELTASGSWSWSSQNQPPGFPIGDPCHREACGTDHGHIAGIVGPPR